MRPAHQRNRHKPLILGPLDIEWEWSPQGLRTGIFSKDTSRSMVLASYVTQTREKCAKDKTTTTFLKFHGVSGKEASQLRSLVVNHVLLHTISGFEPGVFRGFTSLQQIIVFKGEFDVSGPSKTSLIMKLWPEIEMRMEGSNLKTLLQIDAADPKLA